MMHFYNSTGASILKKIPTISAHSLTEFGLFSICSALKMIWKSASGMWASAIAVRGCDTTAELGSLPKLTVMRKRSDAVEKKTPRLPAILSVSQHSQPMFSSLKTGHPAENFMELPAVPCYAVLCSLSSLCTLSFGVCSTNPSDTCDMTRAPFATWRGTKYIYQDVACLRTVTFH